MRKAQKQVLKSIVLLEKQAKDLRNLFLKQTNGKKWIGAKEFAEICGKHPNTISNYCREGRIKTTRTNNKGRYEIHIDELANF
jgi:hypothetical protein